MANTIENKQQLFNSELPMPSTNIKDVGQIANETLQQSLKTPSQTSQTSQQTQSTEEKPYTTNAQLYEYLNRGNVETPEQAAKREKQERSSALIAAIGDGISALSNMYFANKGAQSSYVPDNTLSAKMQARRDMLQKEREARRREYNEGYMRAHQLDLTLNENREKRALTKQQMEDKWKQFNIDQERKAKEHADKLSLAELERQLKEKFHLDDIETRKLIARYNQKNANYRAGLGSTSTTSVGKDANGNVVKTTTVEKGKVKKGQGYGAGGEKGRGY